MNKSFNMQSLVLLLLMDIIIDVTYLISWIYINFRRLLCKECDVGHYGVMKLMIIGQCS